MAAPPAPRSMPTPVDAGIPSAGEAKAKAEAKAVLQIQARTEDRSTLSGLRAAAAIREWWQAGLSARLPPNIRASVEYR